MEIQVIQIGNSRGIILSRAILERYNIQNKVQLELRKNHINITPVNETRKDWDRSLTVMNSKGEDILLMK